MMNASIHSLTVGSLVAIVLLVEDCAPFDAEAVRANLARIRDPGTHAKMTTAYIAPYIDGVVIDRTTFQANLREPYSAFLNVLAQSWFGLVSPKAIRENPGGLVER